MKKKQQHYYEAVFYVYTDCHWDNNVLGYLCKGDQLIRAAGAEMPVSYPCFILNYD